MKNALVTQVKYSTSCFKGGSLLWPAIVRRSVFNPLRNLRTLTTGWLLICSNSIATRQTEFTPNRIPLALLSSPRQLFLRPLCS